MEEELSPTILLLSAVKWTKYRDAILRRGGKVLEGSIPGYQTDIGNPQIGRRKQNSSYKYCVPWGQKNEENRFNTQGQMRFS